MIYSNHHASASRSWCVQQQRTTATFSASTSYSAAAAAGEGFALCRQQPPWRCDSFLENGSGAVNGRLDPSVAVWSRFDGSDQVARAIDYISSKILLVSP